MNQQAITEAIRLIQEEGMSANKAADKVAEPLGVTGRTVKAWAEKAGTPLGDFSQEAAQKARDTASAQAAARRAELSNLMLGQALKLMRRFDEEHIDYRGKDAAKVRFERATSVDVKNYAVAVAVLIDKIRLEEGSVTGRTEHVALTEAERVLREEVERMQAAAEAHANQ